MKGFVALLLVATGCGEKAKASDPWASLPPLPPAKVILDNPDGIRSSAEFDLGPALVVEASQVATRTCAGLEISYAFDARARYAAWSCGEKSGSFALAAELDFSIREYAEKYSVPAYKYCDENRATIVVSAARDEMTIVCPGDGTRHELSDDRFITVVVPYPG